MNPNNLLVFLRLTILNIKFNLLFLFSTLHIIESYKKSQLIFLFVKINIFKNYNNSMHPTKLISASLHNKSHSAGVSVVMKKIKQYKNVLL